MAGRWEILSSMPVYVCWLCWIVLIVCSFVLVCRAADGGRKKKPYAVCLAGIVLAVLLLIINGRGIPAFFLGVPEGQEEQIEIEISADTEEFPYRDTLVLTEKEKGEFLELCRRLKVTYSISGKEDCQNWEPAEIRLENRQTGEGAAVYLNLTGEGGSYLCFMENNAVYRIRYPDEAVNWLAERYPELGTGIYPPSPDRFRTTVRDEEDFHQIRKEIEQGLKEYEALQPGTVAWPASGRNRTWPMPVREEKEPGFCYTVADRRVQVRAIWETYGEQGFGLYGSPEDQRWFQETIYGGPLYWDLEGKQINLPGWTEGESRNKWDLLTGRISQWEEKHPGTVEYSWESGQCSIRTEEEGEILFSLPGMDAESDGEVTLLYADPDREAWLRKNILGEHWKIESWEPDWKQYERETWERAQEQEPEDNRNVSVTFLEQKEDGRVLVQVRKQGMRYQYVLPALELLTEQGWLRVPYPVLEEGTEDRYLELEEGDAVWEICPERLPELEDGIYRFILYSMDGTASWTQWERKGEKNR